MGQALSMKLFSSNLFRLILRIVFSNGALDRIRNVSIFA